MSWLREEVERVLKIYPTLQSDFSSKVPILSGRFTAHDPKSGLEIEDYEIRVHLPNAYPNALPKVWETEGKIKRHLLADGSLCFGNPQDIGNLVKDGLRLGDFFSRVLNPHLCREYAVDTVQTYPDGERSHGLEGVWEGYYDLFKTTDKATILNELSLILSRSRMARNQPCYCGSSKKYKRCHYLLENTVMRPGRANVESCYQLLLKYYKTHNEKI